MRTYKTYILSKGPIFLAYILPRIPWEASNNFIFEGLFLSVFLIFLILSGGSAINVDRDTVKKLFYWCE